MLLVSSFLMAQVPEAFKYQAVVCDNSGKVVAANFVNNSAQYTLHA
jgi:hypothetical protein